ncbi:MAG: hypothetical protein WB615_07330 [Candidatus Tumulicola sp.]
MTKLIEEVTLRWEPWFLLVVCVLAGIGTGVLLHLVLSPAGRWFSSHKVLSEHHEIAGHFIGVVGVIYAVLVAFVVVTAWQSHRRAEDLTLDEQRSAGDLFQIDGAYHASYQPAKISRFVLARYVAAMSDEWLQMKNGVPLCGEYSKPFRACTTKDDSYELAADECGYDIVELTFATDPKKADDAVLYHEGIDLAQAISEDRREIGIHYRERTLPPVIWMSFLLGALILAAMTYCVTGQNQRSQLVRTASFFGMIGMMVALALVFDHPFMGKMQVDGSEWGTMHARFEKALNGKEPLIGSGHRTLLPCPPTLPVKM